MSSDKAKAMLFFPTVTGSELPTTINMAAFGSIAPTKTTLIHNSNSEVISKTVESRVLLTVTLSQRAPRNGDVNGQKGESASSHSAVYFGPTGNTIKCFFIVKTATYYLGLRHSEEYRNLQ